MSRGLTIADFVQQVFYAIYKVRLDVTFDPALPQAFHASTDKFKEILMEGNFVLQELQKDQDWNWLRSRWCMGTSEVLEDSAIMEFELPETAYKVCTGYGDSVRLHNAIDETLFMEIPFISPRTGTMNKTAMFDQYARPNVPDNRLTAFVVGRDLTFNRPFYASEAGGLLRTDVIDLLPELHICDASCAQPCRHAYEDVVFTEIPDPYYMVVRTAARRAEGDPSVSERVMALADEASKLLSAMRENDSSKTFPDEYGTVELGYTRVL